MKAKTIVTVIGAVVLFGIVMGTRKQLEMARGRVTSGNQALAQAYFRLGVATGDLVNLQRRINGKPEISGPQLYRESVQQDIEASNGTTLLKLP